MIFLFPKRTITFGTADKVVERDNEMEFDLTSCIFANNHKILIV